MYSTPNYVATPTAHYSDRVTADKSCDSYVVRRQSVTCGTNVVTPVGQITVTIVSDGARAAEEVFLKPRPPWHQPEAKYDPPCRDVVPSWKVKWRLKQQRPRDGLR